MLNTCLLILIVLEVLWVAMVLEYKLDAIINHFDIRVSDDVRQPWPIKIFQRKKNT